MATKKVVLQIEGMTCASCVAAVAMVLSDICVVRNSLLLRRFDIDKYHQ